MRTAIVYSGHMRSFERCLLSHAEHLLGQLEDVEVFVSTVHDADAHKAELLREYFRKVTIKIEPSQPDCISDLRAAGCDLPREWVKGMPYMKERYAISVHPQAIARQLWQMEQAWKMARGIPFDCVVRIRPDIAFAHRVPMHAPASLQALTPWWGRFDGVNDRFAILGYEAAKAYFATYSAIPTLLRDGADLHPETLVARSLKAAGVQVKRNLGALFSTVRANGEVRPPEITPDDVRDACELALT